MFTKLKEILTKERPSTGTQIRVGTSRRGGQEVGIEEVLGQTAEALNLTNVTRALILMQPGADGRSAYATFCEEQGIDEETTVIGGHLVHNVATGAKSALLREIEAQEREAIRQQQEAARPLGQKAVQLARRGVGKAIKLAGSPLTAGIREIRSFTSWESENKW